MSKRAGQAVGKIHNRALLEAEKYATSHAGSIIEEVAFGREFKAGFIEGYEQAEKDLALTWEDMAKIDAIIISTNNEFATDVSKKISRQTFYEEVLKRFNELKK